MLNFYAYNRVVKILSVGLTLITFSAQTFAQQTKQIQQAEQTMLKATQFMTENVSTNGGYVWYYLPDLSRRWGEMEAYKTMVWIQDGGTVSVGHMLLDAYHVTGEEYYYQAAEKAAAALIWGQSNAGGWNYMIDFAGDASLKTWYNTIGKNGWRLEEFQHYYGNDTYDDDVSSDAARFLLRMYLEKLDPKYKPALNKAIGFLLKSQYPIGAWPQRYPLHYDFNKAGHADYTSYYTFNDDVIWENTNFLIQCYQTLGDARLLDPINRGMNFYLLSQSGNGAWGQQYNEQMQVMGARTYEPAAYLPKYTFGNAMLLLKFYEYTGDRRYLEHVPAAIAWLEKQKLPADKTVNGQFTHPTFVDVATDKPIYVHRKGSNVIYGKYYVDTIGQNTLGHYRGKTIINIQKLKDEYARLSAMSVEQVTKDSPIKPHQFAGSVMPQHYYDLNRDAEKDQVTGTKVNELIKALDGQGRWLVKHAPTSNPYIGDGINKDETAAYAGTHVGDKTDTSPYRDTTDQEYISTIQYIRNMNMLIKYIRDEKGK